MLRDAPKSLTLQFSRLGDLIDSLCAVCAASSPPARRDAVDQARILRAALAILQVLLSSARKFRENPRCGLTAVPAVVISVLFLCLFVVESELVCTCVRKCVCVRLFVV